MADDYMELTAPEKSWFISIMVMGMLLTGHDFTLAIALAITLFMCKSYSCCLCVCLLSLCSCIVFKSVLWLKLHKIYFHHSNQVMFTEIVWFVIDVFL